MSRSIISSSSSQPAEPVVESLSPAALEYARRAKTAHTKRMYRAAWDDFQEYCRAHRRAAMPARPATVIDYLIFLAGGAEPQKVSTLQLKLAAIAEAHRLARQPDPTVDADVRTVMAGIRRTLGVAPEKKAPVMRAQLAAMVQALPDGLAGRRDKAIILVGWAGAFRRSELVGLDVADVRFAPEQLTIRLRRSKTDPEGRGKTKILPLLDEEAICPVRALRVWLDAAHIQRGPLFRAVDRWGHVRRGRLSDKMVAVIVKRSARRAGLDPAAFAGHSLRSGFITEAAGAGADTRDIMQQTGHTSERVMREYIQDAGRGAAAAVRAAFGEKKAV